MGARSWPQALMSVSWIFGYVTHTNRVGFIEKIAVMDVYDEYGSIGFIVYLYIFIY